MDRNKIKEIIEDFENISKIVNNRLKQLYAMIDEKPLAPKNNSTKESIEKTRQEMMRQIEEMRRQALAQVQDSIKGVGGNMMPSMMGMPGGMPGGMPSGMPGGMVGKRPPMAPEKTEKLEPIKTKETEEDGNG